MAQNSIDFKISNSFSKINCLIVSFSIFKLGNFLIRISLILLIIKETLIKWFVYFVAIKIQLPEIINLSIGDKLKFNMLLKVK